MNRCLIIVSIVLLLFGFQGLFAQSANTYLPEPVLNEYRGEMTFNSPGSVFWLAELNDEIMFLRNFGFQDEVPVEFLPSQILAAADVSDANVPRSIRNNRYFLESVRLTNLAQQSFDEGDYDASFKYSEEAVRFAQLSDDFVRLQLKIKETDDAIAAARRRLDFAASVNAASRYPSEYSQAQTAFTEARTFRAAESWDEAIAAANRVLSALSAVTGDSSRPAPPPPPPPPVQQPEPTRLPSQYTVRPWATTKDCLWNIAGRPWVYNDPKQWRRLYDANKSRMPQANNPDLIEPGMILDIPSIRGETRQGMWDAGKSYPSLP